MQLVLEYDYRFQRLIPARNTSSNLRSCGIIVTFVLIMIPVVTVLILVK